MKILMLNYEFPPLGGGASNATYYLLKEFSKSNLEIDLITSSPNKYRIEKFSDNIRIVRLNVYKKQYHYQTFLDTFWYSLKTYLEIHKYEKHNLCHAFFAWPCGLFGYLLKSKMPYIVSLRGSDVPGYNKRLEFADVFFRPYSRLVLKNAKKVVANSQGLKELAHKTWKGKIDVIYNGVNTEEFKPKKTNNKKIQVISVGRLIKRKGFNYMIKALPKGFELTIVGEGPEHKKLKSLNQNVNFVGRIPHKDISSYLAKSDIFCLPSLNEGMSNAVLEAMACGLPIVATNVGGSNELIKDNGFIVQKKSSSSIRKALLQYLNNKSLIRQHGKQSRKIAEKMTWTRVAQQYQEIYNELA